MTARVFIDGEAGTTGLQIRERLACRRDVELLSIDPSKRKDLDARAELLNAADIAILCLPDAAAVESVSLIKNTTTKVIDASTAHRVDPNWVYGFAEMASDQEAAIAGGRFVANPGCYPQGLIACVRPLIAAGLLPADYPVVMNAISGYSGGGRQMMETYEAEYHPAPYMPYGLTFNHKHLPEMKHYSGLKGAPLFQPAVGNYAQGMVTSVPLQLSTLPRIPKAAELHAALADYYPSGRGFVEVAPLEHLDKTPELDPETYNGTNIMRLHIFANDDKAQALLMAVYDNLGKGASGAAVQNLNLMLGIDQKQGLSAG